MPRPAPFRSSLPFASKYSRRDSALEVQPPGAVLCQPPRAPFEAGAVGRPRAPAAARGGPRRWPRALPPPRSAQGLCGSRRCGVPANSLHLWLRSTRHHTPPSPATFSFNNCIWIDLHCGDASFYYLCAGKALQDNSESPDLLRC